MKFFCINCGHPNNYSSLKPESCSKCGVSTAASKIKPVPMNTVFKDFSLEESEEPVLKPLEFEPFTEAELESFNVAGANQSFNMGNLIKGQDIDKIARRRGRTPKR